MSDTAAVAVPEWARGVEELTLPVSREEMEARRDAILARMAEEGIDVAVFTTTQSVIYLTGNQAGGTSAQNRLVLSSSGEHRFVVRKIDSLWEGVWAGQNWVNNWHVYRDEHGSDEATADAVRAVHPGPVRRLGLELNRQSISYDSVRKIASLTGAAELVSSTALVEDLRVIKSDAEVALMRRAGKISCKASDALVDALRQGATDVEAAAAAQMVIMAEGGLHAPQEPYVFSGPGGETGHMPWMRTAPGPGEVTTWFLSGVTRQYASPIERTVLRLPDTNGVERLVDSVVHAVESLVDRLRPGMTSEEAYQIAFDAHRGNGLDQYFPNHAGYSIGIHWPEFALFRLRAGDKRVIKSGMAFHLVPLLVVPKIGCICASRAIVVKDTGVELLNDYPLRVEAFER